MSKLDISGRSSRKAAQKALAAVRDEEAGGPFPCLNCVLEFNSRGALLSHLRKRKHFKSPDEVKKVRQEFIDDFLPDNVSTPIEAQQYADDGNMTEEQLNNWKRINVHLAFLEKFF